MFNRTLFLRKKSCKYLNLGVPRWIKCNICSLRALAYTVEFLGNYVFKYTNRVDVPCYLLHNYYDKCDFIHLVHVCSDLKQLTFKRNNPTKVEAKILSHPECVEVG